MWSACAISPTSRPSRNEYVRKSEERKACLQDSPSTRTFAGTFLLIPQPQTNGKQRISRKVSFSSSGAHQLFTKLHGCEFRRSHRCVLLQLKLARPLCTQKRTGARRFPLLQIRIPDQIIHLQRFWGTKAAILIRGLMIWDAARVFASRSFAKHVRFLSPTFGEPRHSQHQHGHCL